MTLEEMERSVALLERRVKILGEIEKCWYGWELDELIHELNAISDTTEKPLTPNKIKET